MHMVDHHRRCYAAATAAAGVAAAGGTSYSWSMATWSSLKDHLAIHSRRIGSDSPLLCDPLLNDGKMEQPEDTQEAASTHKKQRDEIATSFGIPERPRIPKLAPPPLPDRDPALSPMRSPRLVQEPDSNPSDKAESEPQGTPVEPATPISSPARSDAPSTGGSSFGTAVDARDIGDIDFSPGRTAPRRMSMLGFEIPMRDSDSDGITARTDSDSSEWSAISKADMQGFDRTTDPGNDSGPWWSHRRVLVEKVEIVGTEERTSASSWLGGTYVVCALRPPCPIFSHVL